MEGKKRSLAYVFLEDGTFLNAEIIKQGYGYAYTRFPFKYMDEFRRYQREAREQGRGLWGKVLRLRAVLRQQLLDTGRQLRSCEWLGNVIVKPTFETLFRICMGDLCRRS